MGDNACAPEFHGLVKLRNTIHNDVTIASPMDENTTANSFGHVARGFVGLILLGFPLEYDCR